MVTLVRREPGNALREELPRLAHLFDAYFHQDWDLDGSEDDAIEAFIRGSWPYEVRRTWLELVSLLGRCRTDGELEAAVDEFGAYLGRNPMGMSLRQWLEQVRDRLAEAPRTRFGGAVPIIPARDTAESAAWYRDLLRFEIVHLEPEYAIVERDETAIHFWGPSGIAPEDSNTMFRVRVGGIDELYKYYQAKGIVHPNAPLETKTWGSREFAVTDLDGNLLTFFQVIPLER